MASAGSTAAATDRLFWYVDRDENRLGANFRCHIDTEANES